MDARRKEDEVCFTPYSKSDIKMFSDMLPDLYSKAARDTDFAFAERDRMMDLFQKEFGE